jgi:DNA-binding XRE family transcriptional regulator
MGRYNKLNQLRKSKNIKVEDIMNTLDLKTKSAYYKKENGQIRFSLEEARLISELFKLSIEELFFKSNVPKKIGA